MNLLLVATENGVTVGRQAGNTIEIVRHRLQGQRVTSVIAREGTILAGTRTGVFRSDDLGETWQAANRGLTTPYVRWLAYHPEISDREFAGTEPAAVFLSQDGGQNWQECREVAKMRAEYGWSLPYSPEAGCVRGFTFREQRGYAAVEDGGVLISDDGGEHWSLAPGSRGKADHRPAPGFVHSDVHSIHLYAPDPLQVFAATGGGLYRSVDGGRRWECIYPCYCRDVWVDPHNPDHLILGPADGVDFRGRIETSYDGGQTWSSCESGPGVPWPHHMVERFYRAADLLLAVLSNGEILAAPPGEGSWSWESILFDTGDVEAIWSLDVEMEVGE